MDSPTLRAVMGRAGPPGPRSSPATSTRTRSSCATATTGPTSGAPLTIRLAQVIHHGTDHRSQVCTALTTLGIEPPAIDAWDFAWKDGRLTEPTA